MAVAALAQFLEISVTGETGQHLQKMLAHEAKGNLAKDFHDSSHDGLPVDPIRLP